MLKEKTEENNVIDFSGVPLNLLKKLESVPKERLNMNLIELSKRQIFDLHPEKFDLVLTQTNPESQQIMCDVIDSNLITNRFCIDYLLYCTDKPIKQRRVIKYTNHPNIIYEEMFMISMLGIEDEYLENKLVECFDRNLINNTHDFTYYRKKYEKSNIIKKALKITD